MDSPLKKEFDWYLAHQIELVARFNGRFVVIKGERVLNDFADQVSAVTETQKTHELGTFLVQKVTPGDEAYTQTFHSRASFDFASR